MQLKLDPYFLTWEGAVRDSLPNYVFTLAEYLKEEGYRTGAFIGANSLVSEAYGLYQGFDHTFNSRQVGYKTDKFHLPANALIDKFLSWLSRGSQNHPFFGYVHFMDVHQPYICREDDFQKIKDSPTIGENYFLNDTEYSKLPRRVTNWMEKHAGGKFRNIAHGKRCYAAGVRNFDRAFGRALQLLKTRGYLDNTLIILTSDHGDEFYEHGKFLHGKTLYNEMLHVPLIINVPSGKRLKIPTLVSLIDILPTLLGILKIKHKDNIIQGNDLWPLISGEGAYQGDGWTYASGLPVYPTRLSAQNDEYKIISGEPNGFPGWQKYWEKWKRWDFPKGQTSVVYNLKKDPMEKKDLSNLKPEIKLSLATKLKSYRKTVKQPFSSSNTNPELTEEQKENLRSLGYAQ